MNLILNISMLGKKPTGLGVYANCCANAICKNFNVKIITGEVFPKHSNILFKAPNSISLGNGKLAAIKRMLWMRSLKFDKKSLIYSPTHHGFSHVENQIITIHDLICLRYPSQHKSQFLFFKYALPKILKKCRAVFTVSNCTKNDISKIYDYPRDKIHVVPNGVDSHIFTETNIVEKNNNFLLMVGAKYPHKNVDEVISMSDYWSQKFTLKIASCTGEYRKHLENQAKKKRILHRIEFLDYIERDELIKLYQSCHALIYPSKWEGFGIPPLEALSCQKPVIASNIPVHKEILGDAAFYVTLGNKNSWRLAFKELEINEIITQKHEFASTVLNKYTWNQSSNQLIEALYKVEPELIQTENKKAIVA